MASFLYSIFFSHPTLFFIIFIEWYHVYTSSRTIKPTIQNHQIRIRWWWCINVIIMGTEIPTHSRTWLTAWSYSTSDIILSGDILGAEKLDDAYTKISNAVLGVEVKATDEKDYQKLGEALEILDLEDPVLDFKWFKEEREFHLKILGPIQTEVLKIL